MVLRLGSIDFGLGVDTSALDRSIRTVRAFGDEVERAAARTGKGAAEAAAALRRQEAATLSALQATLNLNASLRRTEAPTSLIDQSNLAFTRLSATMAKTGTSTLEAQRAQEAFKASIGTVRRELAAFNAVADPAKGNKFVEVMRDLAGAATLTIGPLSGLGSRITALSGLLNRSSLELAGMIGGVVAAGVAFSSLSSNTISVGIALDIVRQRLINISGSSASADAELSALREVAERTGTSFLDLAQNFSKFQAAAQGSTMTATQVFTVFNQITTAGASMHLSISSMNEVLLAVEQMMSKGTVSAEELRKQLGNALPGAFAAAAAGMGVTTQALDKMLRKGQLTSSEFLVNFGPALLKMFGTDLNSRITSVQGDLNRLTTATTEFFVAFDQAFGIVKNFDASVQLLTRSLTYLTENMNVLAGAIGAVIGAFIGFNIQGIALGFISATSAVITFVRSLNSLAAVLGVITSIGGGWIGVLARIGAAVAGGIVGYKLLNSVLDDSAAKHGALTDKVDGFITALDKGKDAVAQAGASVQKELALEILARQNQIESINATIAGYQAANEAAKGTGDAAVMQYTLNEALKVQGALLTTAGIQLRELLERWSLLGDAIAKASTTAVNTGKAYTDQQEQEIEHANRLITQNNALAASYGSISGTFENLQRQFKDKDALEQLQKALERTGLKAAEAKEFVDRLAASQQALASTVANKGVDDSIKEFAENYAVAANTVKSAGLGEYIKGVIAEGKQIDEVTKRLISLGVTEGATAEVTKALADSFSKVRDAQNKWVLDTAGQSISDLLNMAAALNQNRGAAEAMSNALADESKIKAFREEIIRYTGDLKLADQLTRLFSQALGMYNEAKAADGLKDINREIDRLNQELAAIPKGAAYVDQLKKSWEIEDKVRAAHDQIIGFGKSEDVATAKAHELGSALTAVAATSDKFTGIKELTRGLGQALTSAADDFISSGKQINDVFSDIFKSVSNLIIKLLVINPLMNALTGASGSSALPVLGGANFFGGGGGTGSNIFGDIFSLGKSLLGFAGGGDPVGGKPILVGENGPEIITPKSGQSIIPNSQIGGGGRMEITVHPSPLFAVTVKQEAQRTTSAGLAAFDKQLPGRVSSIVKDPYKR